MAAVTKIESVESEEVSCLDSRLLHMERHIQSHLSKSPTLMVVPEPGPVIDATNPFGQARRLYTEMELPDVFDVARETARNLARAEELYKENEEQLQLLMARGIRLSSAIDMYRTNLRIFGERIDLSSVLALNAHKSEDEKKSE
jgi:hypothetical protein